MVLQILIDMQRQLYSAKNVLVFAKFWFDLKCFGLEPWPCFVRFTVSKRNWQMLIFPLQKVMVPDLYREGLMRMFPWIKSGANDQGWFPPYGRMEVNMYPCCPVQNNTVMVVQIHLYPEKTGPGKTFLPTCNPTPGVYVTLPESVHYVPPRFGSWKGWTVRLNPSPFRPSRSLALEPEIYQLVRSGSGRGDINWQVYAFKKEG